jgi:hypothetical protein
LLYPDFTQELETAHVSALTSASACSNQNRIVHLVVQRRRGGEVPDGLLAVARALTPNAN